jgi:hypothetical protein
LVQSRKSAKLHAAKSASENKPSVSKAEAVRAALADGVDGLDEMAAFIKTKFGFEISKPMLSSYKANEKKRVAKADESSAPKRGPALKVPASGREDDILRTLETLKPLIASHGSDKLHRLIDVLK